MWSGIILALGWQFAGDPFDIHPVFVGFPLSLIMLLTLTFMPSTAEKVQVEEKVE
ncbi:hypothetical protein MUO14_17650 [Halobacillus shinanisalinarum]|uniref:Uncharacterized protein n=1 Tax=Halobacillus shinanisalinarum TaxID=2932258 RepID=A0ABY4GX40_9BACI|nr:hypothetical protein [Halobacillus shinanisalinarum]UOQ92285.1 hypothetical protein MUO14_17650 [Halobacillus shinanisalinarum]